MKIGIMTFHWATNYGAVMQAYALSEFLKRKGYDTQIIRFEPKNYLISWRNLYQVRSISELKEYIYKVIMEKKINAFRSKYLSLSKKIILNKNGLNIIEKEYNCIIVGSDQIWNQSFLREEGPVYFLNFINSEIKKVSYAASFGSIKFEEENLNKIAPYIMKFDNISVRENTGKDIIRNFRKDVEVVCDPVFLQPFDFYNKFITKSNKKIIFIYMLRNNRDVWIKKLDMLLEEYEIVVWGKKETYTIEEWLSLIYNSSLVVTDSFHGTAFSLIFNTPFISTRIPGSGMNDRIETLLGKLDLINQLDDLENLKKVSSIPKFDWDSINLKLKNYIKKSEDFIIGAIER